jgi:16S rRNA (guanine527-N7)-methyltransferase
VDNAQFAARLQEGAEGLGVSLPGDVAAGLWRFQEELLKWNARVNLTAITAPEEVLEKHFLDSLAVLPEVAGAATVLDLGAGAGFPGIPLRLALPGMSLTLADAVAKKVGFLKQALAVLRLAPGSRALHVRAEGKPDAEGLPRADAVVSRALMEFGAWARLGREYLAPGGRLVAMVGQPLAREEAERLSADAGLRLTAAREYRLPFSGASRQVLVAVRADVQQG